MLGNTVVVEMTKDDHNRLRRMAYEQVMNYEDWHSAEHSEAVSLFERVFHMTIQEYRGNVR